MSTFALPELGEGVLEGELVSWKVKVGDTIVHDHVLCEVMTDKATIEIPAPFDGKITKLMAKEGATIQVDQILVEYDGVSSGKASHAPAPEKAAEAPKAAPAPAKAPEKPKRPAPEAAMTLAPTVGGSVAAAPSTRRLARELGVDLTRVGGSGPSGRVLKEDVEKFFRDGKTGLIAPSRGVGAVAHPSGGEERVAFKGLRKKIAEKMRESKDKAAHFTYVEEADATALVKLREQAKAIGAQKGVKVTFLPFVMKAMVAALKQYPILNSELDEEAGELVIKHYYNISLSIQTEDGLTAPVVKNVEHKSILELARDIQDIVDRARAKKLAREDFLGGSITLTNAGSIGGLFATPVINYPEVAILGFNKIFRKPVVKEVRGVEKVVVRDWTYFSISLDHRVVDGAVGAEFMKLFIRYIENPSLLLLDTF